MNNDEKNISAAEEIVESKTEATPAKQPAPSSAKQNGFGAWWKNLAIGLKAVIISALALIVIIPTLLIVLLGGGEGGFGGAGIGGGSNKNASYKITITTQGGMPMANLPVYIFEYDDGELGDMVDDGIAATDEEGKVTFKLPKKGSYAAKIDLSLPEGYDAQPFYPLVGANLDIKVSSAVIPNTNLAGVKYSMGSVIRDFVVTTTENKQFKLSEVLEEKKAVLINFWYDGCSWCELEFPLMQKAYEKYKDDLAIIALDPPHASGNKDTLTSISQYQNALGLTFDVAMDYAGLYSAFGVEGYPFSAIVDRYGVICFIEPGAITSQRDFEYIFEHFTKENYEQKLVYNKEDIVPKEKPNISMPSSSDMSEAFDGESIDDIVYLPYPDGVSAEEKEYSWPFIIGEKDNETVIYPSNINKEGSYAQLVMELPLKAGDVLAFDYFSSTEKDADILYIMVDGKDIFSISGDSTEKGWKTCYSYVAEEDGNYQLALVYSKDSSDNYGDDTVYLKNLRIVTEADIDEPTYIYRFAATNPNTYGEYQNYVEIFMGTDGYYHVDSPTGPILLANLMSYSRFSAEDYVYNMAVTYFANAQNEYDTKKITEAEYNARKTTYNRLIQYCNYASNSQIYGASSVTEELRGLLNVLAAYFGDKDNENAWIEFCFFYDSYGTEEELADPIKGLATFSAYEAVESTKGSTEFPNSVTYNRVIMPRGLFSKFTPTQSGTYLITSYAPGEKAGEFIDSEAWIFTEDGLGNSTPWYTYLNIDKQNIGMTGDLANVYMMVYLEAGKDYYINIAYGDVYQTGTINFRIERLGGEGAYRFSLASPSFFTALEDTVGNLTETVAGGIKAVLGDDGIWREERNDGRLGSVIYVDFTGITTIFGDKPIYSADPDKMDLIKAGAFNFALSENDLYVLNTLKKHNYDYDATRAALKEELGDAYNKTYTDVYEGSSNVVVGFAVEEVLAGVYHGGGVDMSDLMLSYVDKIIKLGDTITVVNDAGTGVEEYTITDANDPRIGCVAVDADLAEALWKVMDKYTFEGVAFSWLKLCYYEQYFCAATPN